MCATVYVRTCALCVFAYMHTCLCARICGHVSVAVCLKSRGTNRDQSKFRAPSPAHVMAFRVIVKNTFVHIEVDEGPSLARRCRSHSPSPSSLCEAHSTSTDGPGVNSISRRAGRKRPGKKRRVRFERLIDRLVDRSLAEPAFELGSELLPPSIGASAVKTQKVSALVARVASRR